MRTTNETRQPMSEVSHSNPYTGETAGHLFSRGPIVVADGGRADAVDSDADTSQSATDSETTYESERPDTETPADEDQDGEDDVDRMKDVSHTPPHSADTANRVFERGGSEDDVEYEE